MQAYHLRRSDKKIDDPALLDEVLATTRTITLAMCEGDEPYVVMLNHGYDAERRCVYFHSAGAGRKIDILRRNPKVWVLAVDDLGYQHGACDHAFRSVMAGGTVHLLGVSDENDPESNDEKRRALELMVRQQERPENQERVMTDQLNPARIHAVTIGRIDLDEITGKQALPRTG